MRLPISYDLSDLLFRIFFSLIFLGLGLEHLFADEMLQVVMPDWMAFKRLISVLAGLILLIGGLSIALGFHAHGGAVLLGAFLIAVTALIHFPALFNTPLDLPSRWSWLWDVYQRSNLAKNLCLIGVCIHLVNHRVGRYSLEQYFAKDQ